MKKYVDGTFQGNFFEFLFFFWIVLPKILNFISVAIEQLFASSKNRNMLEKVYENTLHVYFV
mgnify:CR=1 FL=1